jgi:aspartate/methionine/tyrosine aminotransferase
MLVPSPGYPLFEPIARAESVRIERYALEYDGRWRLDLESVRRGLEAGARLVVIVEPNPPTASCLDPHEREALVQMCARAGAAIVSDEVFGDFAWDAAHGPLPSWLGESRVPVFVLGGLSKACGLPQMKVAWIAASGPPAERADWLRGLEWLADLFLSVNGPAMEALPGWLRAREAFQNPARARVRANLRTVRAACEREPQLEWLVGRGGWSGILRLPSRRSDEQWALALLEDGVAVHPGHFYDLEIPSCLVASLIVEETRFEDGIRRIASLLARD